jgi:polyhydroxyalkanoate synthesis regulator phasin
MTQLLLFEDSSDERQEIKLNTLLEKYDKLRKSQHARITGLQKEIKDLRSELDFLKSHICKENLFL